MPRSAASTNASAITRFARSTESRSGPSTIAIPADAVVAGARAIRPASMPARGPPRGRAASAPVARGCAGRLYVERGGSYAWLLEATAKRPAHGIAEPQYRHSPVRSETPAAGALQRLGGGGPAPRRIEYRRSRTGPRVRTDRRNGDLV